MLLPLPSAPSPTGLLAGEAGPAVPWRLQRRPHPSFLDCCTVLIWNHLHSPAPPRPLFSLRCGWRTHSARSARISPFPGQRGQTPRLGSYSLGSVLSPPHPCAPHWAPLPSCPSVGAGHVPPEALFRRVSVLWWGSHAPGHRETFQPSSPTSWSPSPYSPLALTLSPPRGDW